MDDHPEQPHNTFVVRFWREWHGEGSDQAIGWRGRIEHVQSGEGIAFREVRQLLTFIERFIKPLPLSPSEESSAPPE